MVVSVGKIVAMTVSVVISIGLPIFLLVFWRKRTGAKVTTALVGALTFVVFVYGLENVLHQLCIYQDTAVSRFIINTPWAYVLYGGFAAGIFEETGRFVAFKLLKKRNERKTSVMYGIGHGGIEAILVAGVAMAVNLGLSIWLNSAGEAAVMAAFGDAAGAMTSGIESLKTAAAPMFLVAGAERISAIILHISLSVLVFLAAKRKGKGWLYPLAILFHAAVDCYAVLYHVGVITSILWIEIGVAILCVAIAYLAYRLYRADAGNGAPQEPAAEPAIETAPETAPENAPQENA